MAISGNWSFPDRGRPSLGGVSMHCFRDSPFPGGDDRFGPQPIRSQYPDFKLGHATGVHPGEAPLQGLAEHARRDAFTGQRGGQRARFHLVRRAVGERQVGVGHGVPRQTEWFARDPLRGSQVRRHWSILTLVGRKR